MWSNIFRHTITYFSFRILFEVLLINLSCWGPFLIFSTAYLFRYVLTEIKYWHWRAYVAFLRSETFVKVHVCCGWRREKKREGHTCKWLLFNSYARKYCQILVLTNLDLGDIWINYIENPWKCIAGVAIMRHRKWFFNKQNL